MRFEFNPYMTFQNMGSGKNPFAGRRPSAPKDPRRARKTAIITSVVLVVIICFFSFYLMLTPVNLHDFSFWLTLIFLICAVTLPYVLIVGQSDPTLTKPYSGNDKVVLSQRRMYRLFRRLPLLAVALTAIAYIAGLPVFHAHGYAGILSVQDAVFADDLSESLSTDSIALMDTASAKMLGDREIGSLSNVVSQYNVSGFYTQIDLRGKPKKVAPLDYAGFFKWIGNRANGVPGYVIVDPVSMSADYTQVSEGMIYVPSAYLHEDAARKMRFSHPTRILGNLHFEVDEDGHPYYIACAYTKKIAVFGGTTISGAVILDPITGESVYYDLADVPRWADDVYDGELLCEQFNWYGQLQNGFLNSMIGKKGCRRVTTYRSSDDENDDDIPVSDYGYVAKDGDIWIYTGVTSVNSDSSNIGFLLANERTGEAHYYNIAGADEKSAMAAAEGEVQEKRYQASFPSLINIDEHPTYIMVLKDASGLVKLFAAVNVEQYNLVTTAATQKECLEKYRRMMGIETAGGSDEVTPSGAADDEEVIIATDEKTITIAQIRYIDINGNTYIYLISTDQEIFRAKAAAHDEMLLLEAGDQVLLTFNNKDIVTCELHP